VTICDEELIATYFASAAFVLKISELTRISISLKVNNCYSEQTKEKERISVLICFVHTE